MGAIIFSELLLTKKDITDIDVFALSNYIDISPSQVKKATVSPGKIIIDDNNIEYFRQNPHFEEGLTIIEPFFEGKFVIHSFCSYQTRKIVSNDINDSISILENMFSGKAKSLKEACLNLNLMAKVIINIKEEELSIHDIVLSAKSILFWNDFNIDIEIKYDFY